MSTETRRNLSQEEINKIAEIDNKVSIEEGKGLSTNDYTDSDKEKVSKIPSSGSIGTSVEEVPLTTHGKTYVMLFVEEGSDDLSKTYYSKDSNNYFYIETKYGVPYIYLKNNLVLQGNTQFNKTLLASNQSLSGTCYLPQSGTLISDETQGRYNVVNVSSASNITLDSSKFYNITTNAAVVLSYPSDVSTSVMQEYNGYIDNRSTYGAEYDITFPDGVQLIGDIDTSSSYPFDGHAWEFSLNSFTNICTVIKIG